MLLENPPDVEMEASPYHQLQQLFLQSSGVSDSSMHLRRMLSTLVLLAGVQWGCHTAAHTGVPSAEDQSPTPHAQQALHQQMDCYALGVFAFQVAQTRDTTGLTKEEALSLVSQALTQRLRTTATPAEVTATGTRLSSVVERVYRSPAWTPEGAAFQILTLCWEHDATPR
jgi:hypothetical protein